MNIKNLISLDNPFRLLYHKLRAITANFLYGFPSKGMTIIGVTGTNGKTTCSNIIAKGLREAGKKVFLFSTVNIIIGDKEYTNHTKMTSPDAFDLQRYLKQAKEEGCEVAVIETASHGIKMHRNWGIDYDIAVLTNITQDHLDLHKTMHDYVHTKLELFKNLIRYKRKPGVKKTAIINAESDYKELFLEETYDTLYIYGNDEKANLKATQVKQNINGMTFNVIGAGVSIQVKTQLIGEFNIQNILASIGVFISFGFKPEQIEKAINGIVGIPGRMEEIKNLEGYKIIVDYAHTADALENVLSTLNKLEGIGKIHTVFGATGDRDKTKRPIMGEIVSRMSDVVILTEDDDYSEKVEEIIKDVLPGIGRKEGEDFWIINNRREAIRTALVTAEKNDIILIAGKGDEHVMVTNKGHVTWHDKTVIEEILEEIDQHKMIH
ncbi:MAG: UDP-N-acetylmuramoyl-L-alanyl-D-glutamate--2,6-diaminopimelate ligase [Candidatus Gracilibacteria bacterium]|nr:UDP-N-acetylmuramoyl-L-alanyl-D-glutamate--2,6-diaminopimelate ligase [Candidatus Gracilibacteria bacterium]